MSRKSICHRLIQQIGVNNTVQNKKLFTQLINFRPAVLEKPSEWNSFIHIISKLLASYLVIFFFYKKCINCMNILISATNIS